MFKMVVFRNHRHLRAFPYFLIFFLLSNSLRAQPLVLTEKNPAIKFELGIASYAFRQKPLDELLHLSRLLDIYNLALKSVHLPLDAGDQEFEMVKSAAKEAGVDLYAGAVIYMKSEAEVQQAFDYADQAGMSMIVGVPNPELIDLCEQMVKKYNIQLAIHNHGSRNILYPDAGSAYELIKDKDPRMGLCIDAGHTMRLNLDPADEIRKYSDRVLDVQIWDVTSASADGKSTLAGYGVLNFKDILQALADIEYQGVVAVEYWNDPENPAIGTAQTIGYLQAIMNDLTTNKSAIPDNQLSQVEKENGWQVLFNGNNAEGWRGINQDKFPDHGWKVSNGNLCSVSNQGAESANGGDIVTLKEYQDFVLTWEWKMESRGGNSGVKYFVQEGVSDNQKYGYGIEYQILDDANHAWMLEGKMKPGDYRTVGSAYEIFAAENKKLKPLNTWNSSTIKVEGGKVEHWMNGIKVLEFDRFGNAFEQKVKESKFADIDDFGQWEQGHILLQDHGSDVCFKNIKIKEL